MSPAPLRRKRPGLEETQDCDCCGEDCGCKDCERCRDDDAVQVAQDWIPPPATGAKGAGSSPRKPRVKGK